MEKERKIQVFYEILRASDQPFVDERDKMKFLDMVSDIKRGTKVYVLAFCITDEEIHLLVSGRSAKKLALMEEELIEKFSSYYKDKHQEPYEKLTREIKFRKFMKEDEIMNSCLKLHLIPMKLQLARRPEDYWWCSYIDYRGRYREGIVNTEVVLQYLDTNRNCAIRKFVSIHHNFIKINEWKRSL